MTNKRIVKLKDYKALALQTSILVQEETVKEIIERVEQMRIDYA